MTFISFLFLVNNNQGRNEISPINKKPIVDMDIHEWFTIFDSNENLTHEAIDIFKRKYSNKTLVIINPQHDAKYVAIYDNLERIFIHHFDTALNFLRIFGHLISSLRIEYSEFFISQNNPGKINKFINFYCSETLTQLSVDTYDKNLFIEMTKPFKKVEILFLGGQFNSVASFSHSFVELFPVIQKLYLQHLKIIDKSYIDQEFIHLQYLHVQLCYDPPPMLSLTYHENDDDDDDEPQQGNNDEPQQGNDDDLVQFCSAETDIERLLWRNPQIQSLSLTYSSPKLLNIVNKTLPHIRNLTLVSFNPSHVQNEEESDVIFKYITNFTLLTGMGEVPYNIFFEQLKELYIEATPLTEWFILAERNQNLEKLLMKGGYVDNEQFQRIVSGNTKLIETTLYVSDDVWDESIINFLKNGKHLKKVVFISENSNRFNNTLWTEFKDEWRITEYVVATVLERSLDTIPIHLDTF